MQVQKSLYGSDRDGNRGIVVTELDAKDSEIRDFIFDKIAEHDIVSFIEDSELEEDEDYDYDFFGTSATMKVYSGKYDEEEYEFEIEFSDYVTKDEIREHVLDEYRRRKHV